MGITLVRQVAPGSAAIVARYGVWVVLVSLVGAVAFTPLSTIPIPDITVFGRYTYLVTEIVFGALAFILLLRAGRDALRSAWLTIAVVYPIAYVWDWYTLTVRVFSIPLRTGYVFVGIPIEEHLFMVVVPGLVLAVHETRRSVRTE
jgi:lycopene cyclase domain-containing protein